MLNLQTILLTSSLLLVVGMVASLMCLAALRGPSEQEAVRAVGSDDSDSLVLHRSERTIALLNKFPYSSGHFMVAPVRHIGEFGDLDEEEVLELHRLASSGIGALAQTYAPQGYNVGWNLGRIAGAGVVDHVHMHVVPRWGGDTNFMPVLADTKVLPEHLQETRRRLSDSWPR